MTALDAPPTNERAGEGGRLAGRLARWPLVALVPVVLALVVLLAAMARERWFPTGDLGQAELHVRGFLEHPPLVGAAGRIGTIEDQGSHPGPSLWLALYPTYLLFGRSSFGMMAGTVVLHVAAMVGAVVVAKRIGGAALGWLVVAALGVLTLASGAMFFVEPWNPWAAVLPYLVFLLLVAGILLGDRVLLPWAVAVGTHCIQSHVGYAVLVGALLAVATTSLVWRSVRRGGPGWRWLIGPIAVSLAVGVVMWLPPVVDQLRRDPGNLSILWDHFTNPDEPFVGPAAAFKAFAGEFNLAGGWLVGEGHMPGDDPAWPGFAALVALVVAGTVLAWRWRDRVGLALHAVVVVGALVGVFAMSRIFGEFYPYVIRWMWPLTALAVVAPTYVVARHLLDRPAGHHRSLVLPLAAGAVVLVASVLAGADFASAELPSRRDSRLVGGVVPGVAARLDPARRYLVRWHDPVSLGGVGFGAVLELERRGITAGVDPWARAGALPHRVMPEQTADEVLWVVTGDTAIDAFRARPDATELGVYDQRTPEERARASELLDRLEQRLTEIGQADLIDSLDTQYGLAPLVIGDAPVTQDVRDIAAEYVGLRLPIGVFSVPPFSPLYPP